MHLSRLFGSLLIISLFCLPSNSWAKDCAVLNTMSAQCHKEAMTLKKGHNVSWLQKERTCLNLHQGALACLKTTEKNPKIQQLYNELITLNQGSLKVMDLLEKGQ